MQDREIKFDCTASQLSLRRGEVLLDSLANVEDTKGNNGEHGKLQVTSLRLTWESHKNPRTNLRCATLVLLCYSMSGVSVEWL